MEERIQELDEGGGSEGRGGTRGEEKKGRGGKERLDAEKTKTPKVPVQVTSREAGRTLSLPGLDAP